MNLSELAAMLLAVALVIAVAQWRKKSQRLNASELEILIARREVSRLNERLDLGEMVNAAIMDTALNAMLVVDAEGRIVMLNQAARDLFAEHGEPEGETLMSVTRNHELDALTDKVMRGEPLLETQIELQAHSFRVRGTAMPKSGQYRVALVLQDISELLRLTRARREMVANFSHGLRNRINSIRVLVDALRHNFGHNAERDQRLLGKIAGETDSLQHMTQELIDLSMIESGQAIIRMVPVKFADILRDAFNVMGTQVEQKKLELVAEIPDDLQVLVDPEQTRRVITNILHNSVKFTPAGGKIGFVATNQDQKALIRVTDTGPGIPPQDRARIFEPFYQVDTARRGQPGGEVDLELGPSSA